MKPKGPCDYCAEPATVVARTWTGGYWWRRWTGPRYSVQSCTAHISVAMRDLQLRSGVAS